MSNFNMIYNKGMNFTKKNNSSQKFCTHFYHHIVATYPGFLQSLKISAFKHYWLIHTNFSLPIFTQFFWFPYMHQNPKSFLNTSFPKTSSGPKMLQVHVFILTNMTGFHSFKS